MKATTCVSVFILAAFCSLFAQAAVFDGQGDFQTDQHGYYYTITGGLFPTGTTPNGDNGSGGTFRYLTDDPAWGSYTLGVWHKDDWFQSNAGIALTLKNTANAIVYDNNGIETNSSPNGYYDFANYNANNPLNPGAGVHVGYSMSNVYDWIYAGYFKLTATTTVKQLTGYFVYSGTSSDITAGFNPNDPAVRYHMNIFSKVAGDLPFNTGSFAGDVFSSDYTSGTFKWSDTGYDRIGSASQQDIYRLTYTLDTPIKLAAGEYYFSHDASVVPEASTLIIWSLLGACGFGAVCWRRKRRV